jgi:hypothetical protein
VAGTGIGKSALMNEIVYHLITGGADPVTGELPDHKPKVGRLCFEDMRRDAILSLMSIHVNQRLHLRPLPIEEMRRIHREVFGTRMVEMFDPQTAEWAMEAILGYVRYMAKALECEVLEVDPLSFIAAGLDLETDERRALDKASRDLAATAKELGVAIHVTHHLKRTEGTAHEEGAATSLNQLRGSGGMANFAAGVIGWERDQQGEDPFMTTGRGLKVRRAGVTGPLSILRYNPETGRYEDTPWRKGQPLPQARGFAPVTGPHQGDY